MKYSPYMISLLVMFLVSRCSDSPANVRDDGQMQIHDIQGCAHNSPLQGESVKGIRGVVTARSDNGYYLQGTKPDGLVCSSEAIFVFTETYPDVRPGDLMEIAGIVQEYTPGKESDENLSITEIQLEESQTLSRGHQLPDPVEIGNVDKRIPQYVIDNDALTLFQPEEDGIDFFESLEGMLVSVPDGLVVGARNAFNEVVVIRNDTEGGNEFSPEGALLLREDDPNPERIILNMNSVNTQTVNVGDTLQSPVSGILDYEYGNYKVNTFGVVDFIERPNLTQELGPAGTDFFRLASLNVENLSIEDDSRRFENLAELITNQLQSPEILVLHEIMDDSGILDDGIVSAGKTIEKLVTAVKKAGGPGYSSLWLDPEDKKDGGIPGGNIRSVILYQQSAGIEMASPKILRKNPDQIGLDNSAFANTRKPLVAEFQINDREVVVIAVHLTSKGADSPIFGSQQPIIQPELEKRIAQAKAVQQFTREILQNQPDTIVIVTGDFNDYPWSETLRAVKGEQILFDTGELISQESRYSYILDGNAFQFDYILVSELLNSVDMDFHILHVNSILDSTLQISDHDPVLLDFKIP